MMKNYFEIDEWSIIENGFHPDDNKIYESIMSLGNGRMGIRGNFEEDYTGESLQGTYIAGVYYPDKTRVGWWKNGYPEYFAKVLNAANFIGIHVIINGINLDISKTRVKDFTRILDMKDAYLLRKFTVIDDLNRETHIEAKRFLSSVRTEIAAISYSVTPINYDADITFIPYLDGNVYNQDSNYDEKFWTEVDKGCDADTYYLTMKTKKLDFHVNTTMKYDLQIDGSKIVPFSEDIIKENYVGSKTSSAVPAGSTITLFKYISVTTNRYFKNEELISKSHELVNEAYKEGFENLLERHSDRWHNHWAESDIVIKGDAAAQQAIRFNIFQLNETYTGDDPRLNIGPKGFTGEKYGGCTYWDTEAYCIPFYLSTQDKSIARQLLIYRYDQLEKAKENAKKLGMSGALYPMVTMNGEECHNEWEITFEELHRNAAISYAIFNYVRYTGDESYLADYGFEVLVETGRFWASRVTYNKFKDKYMMLGVTGPNEYENNVNNNWYTNTMVSWNLQYAMDTMALLQKKYPSQYEKLKNKLQIKDEEIAKWKEIIEKMYYPCVESLGVFEQQDGYMDKEQLLVSDLKKSDLPLNQNWSWDRILRSCFIKQADVLQGIYFLEDRYDPDTIKRNFDFYEPRTVHESSLSSCIHSIIASKIGYEEKAYELYLRTARLDLDNYNNDTEDGLHITSMAGTWMSIIQGFGGMRVISDTLSFRPFMPKAWTQYSFRTLFRGRLIELTVNTDNIIIELKEGSPLTVKVFDNDYLLKKNNAALIKQH